MYLFHLALLALALVLSDHDTHQRVLTIQQVADELQVSRRTVYTLISKGDLQSIKVGHSRRVPRSVLDEFISPTPADPA